MKENLEASVAASSAMVSNSSMSIGGRMACAPQKGLDESSIGASSNSHIKEIDNKFGEEINGEHNDYLNLKTPSHNGLQYITPTSHINN
jgi:hypothetical protein